MTKVCPHIIGWTHNEALLDFIERTQPRIIKVVGPHGHDDMKMAEAKKRSPNSKWLLRYYLDEQPLDNPLENARALARMVEPLAEHYDIFEDYNEIPPFDMELIKRYNDFSAAFGGIIHSWGKEHVTGCWSNGQPPEEAWDYMEECVEFADYVSLHGYGWPTMSGSPEFTLRYRRIWQQLLPSNRPLILSEVGMTAMLYSPEDLGWQHWSWPYALEKKEDRVAAEWAWLLDRLNEDPFVYTANMYTTGRLRADNWGTHDFTPRLYKLVGDYIVGHPSPKEEEEMEQPIRVLLPGGEVKEMELEEYLRGVLPREMGVSAHPEALQAQAVAARCYAMNAIKHPRHAPDADVCATTHCQVWDPCHFGTTDAAIEATRGIVATYNGEVINAFYFGHCDGRTRNCEDVWVQALPYCRSVPCICGYTDLYGHGVGMCQRGAMAMAASGASFKDILWHYYTGIEIDGEKAPEPQPIDYKKKYEDLRNAMTTIRDKANVALGD